MPMKKTTISLLFFIALAGCQQNAIQDATGRSSVSSGNNPIENSPWKNYSNSQHNVSLFYPKDWIYVEGKEQYRDEIFSVAFRPQSPEPGDPTYGMIVLSVYEANLSVDQFIDTHLCDSPDICASSRNAVALTIAGIEAKKIINPPAPVESEVVVLKTGNRIYEISITLDKSYDDVYSLDQKRELFENMLTNLHFSNR